MVTAQSLKGLVVLVVEDDRDALEVVQTLLQEQGAVVTGVGSGHEALASFASCRPDVLVSDIGMPGMDGYELLKELRRLEESRGYACTPAVALTAYGEVQEIVRAGSVGFDRHIGKPLDPRRLIRTLAELADLRA